MKNIEQTKKKIDREWAIPDAYQFYTNKSVFSRLVNNEILIFHFCFPLRNLRPAFDDVFISTLERFSFCPLFREPVLVIIGQKTIEQTFIIITKLWFIVFVQ